MKRTRTFVSISFAKNPLERAKCKPTYRILTKQRHTTVIWRSYITRTMVPWTSRRRRSRVHETNIEYVNICLYRTMELCNSRGGRR